MNISPSSTTISWTLSDADRLKDQSLATTNQAARMTTAVAEYQKQATRLAKALPSLRMWL